MHRNRSQNHLTRQPLVPPVSGMTADDGGGTEAGAEAGAPGAVGGESTDPGVEEGVDEALSRYYEEGDVEAVVLLNVDTQRIDDVALKIAGLAHVEQAHLVTGEYDLVLKVRFADYAAFQRFIVDELMSIDEVTGSETMMVVTTYKG